MGQKAQGMLKELEENLLFAEVFVLPSFLPSQVSIALP